MTISGFRKWLGTVAGAIGCKVVVSMGAVVIGISGAAVSSQNVFAQTNYCNRGVSKAAINAATARYLHESYVLVSKKLLQAVVDDQLGNLGFAITPRERGIAAAHLRYIANPTATVQGAEDIDWESKINVTLRHPVNWFRSPKLLQLTDAHRACADYAARGICTAVGAIKSIGEWRFVGRSILNVSNSCPGNIYDHAKASGRPRLKKSLARIHQLFAAKQRYIWQYKFLQNLNNKPFRKNKPLDMLLYADFFNQSLENGSVKAFAGEYFNPSNPLKEKYPLQSLLRPLVGILISNRLLR